LGFHKWQVYYSLADKVSTYQKKEGGAILQGLAWFICWLGFYLASNLIIAKNTVTNLKIFSVQLWQKKNK
jgi:hypothetical protein